MFISPAFAQNNDTAGMVVSFFPLIVVIGLLMYFYARWERKRANRKEQEQAFEQGKAIGRGIIKTYKGKQHEAIASFQADALAMANNGFFPTSQNWAAGEWSVGAYIVAVLLIFLFGLGLLILGYMLIVKPEGTLTVTYERQAVVEEKTCPMCAERIKAAALVCHFCGQKFSPAEVEAQSQRETIADAPHRDA